MEEKCFMELLEREEIIGMFGGNSNIDCELEMDTYYRNEYRNDYYDEWGYGNKDDLLDKLRIGGVRLG